MKRPEYNAARAASADGGSSGFPVRSLCPQMDLRPTAALIVALMVLPACGSNHVTRSGMALQFPSPMAENARSHGRLVPPEGVHSVLLSEDPLPGDVEIFPGSGAGVLIHFHGSAFIPYLAASDQVQPMTAVSVNLGSGSSAYERPFLNPDAFPALLDTIRAIAPASAAEDPPHVYLSGFSAGYGAVRAILRDHAGEIDGVLLLDGLHASYVPEGRTLYEGGTIDAADLGPFLEYARRSTRGDGRFLFTHSEIFPGTYASTTEAADYLMASLEMHAKPVLEWGPGGMQLLSRAVKGGVTILGFAGNTAPDHVDHLHGLPVFLKMLLNE